MAAQTFMNKKDDGPEATPAKIVTEILAVDPSSKTIVPHNNETIMRSGRFAVRLDPQHPAGQYNRDGVQFVAGTDVYFDAVPDAIRCDPWLMVAKIVGDTPPAYNSHERREKQAGRLL